MRLIYKLTIIYLIISLIVLAAGGLFTYMDVKYEIDMEEKRFLKERLQSIESFIERRDLQKDFTKDKITIRYLGESAETTPIAFSDTTVMHSTLQRPETHTLLTTTKQINGKFYAISIYDLIVEEDDIAEGVIKSLVKTLAILLVLILLLSLLASKILLRPFESILARIKSFNIKEEKPIYFPNSGTRELNQLSKFLNEMTSKMKQDYQALKEFTENASHELQTPLSIASGKLELLMEDNHCTDKQLELAVAAQNNIKRLSHMSSSLTLITKIENREFDTGQRVDLSAVLAELIDDFNELIQIKGLRLEQNIAPEVIIKTNRSLLYIMLTNLLKNAINHNIGEHGYINILLEGKSLIIENSGPELTLPPEDMFLRFKKDVNKSYSMGLGLSIVKRIIEINNWHIGYSNQQTIHKIKVTF